jgi:UTP--glucose-1-phosphate uridylyltransferase
MNISTRKQKITKAVIAAAGYGTRFLPATKSQPKEMLPIVDKPIIHYLVEEAVNSGIKDIIIVVRSGQVSLEDYFDSNPALEAELESKGKKDLLEEVQKIHKMANFIFVRQSSDLPYGSATPLLSATPIIEKGEPFVYMFGDDLTISENPITKQIIDAYEKEKADVALGVQEVSWDDVHKYGTVRYKKGSDSEIEEACEKLSSEEAPSNKAVFGRFVLPYSLLEEIKKAPLGKNGELCLVNILNNFAKEGKVIAPPIKGEWHTTGDPLSYLKTSLRFAMERDDMREGLKSYLSEKRFKK